jgi:type IV secretory pathway VirB6-like protein
MKLASFSRRYMPSLRMLISISLALVAANILMILLSDPALASPPPLTPRGTCSDDPDFKINLGGGQGIITNIVSMMQSTLNSTTQSMYNSIIGNTGYLDAVRGACLLYIAITGLMFTAGAVQITISDLMVRTTKVAIVAIIISPTSWTFFNSYVVEFFNKGTDEIIEKVSSMVVEGTELGGMPFAPLDYAISKALSAKMWVTILATYLTGPNGMLIGFLIMSGLGSFLRSVINAMWVYLMALIVKTLMFGIAPLFIPFILFQRTRHLFDGWLNQVVNACLQPILIFAFFAFFVMLVSACIDTLLYNPVCWTGWHESLRGSPFVQHWWRFTVYDSDTGTMMPYGGIWNFTGAESAGSVEFPIDVLMVLMFMVFAELMMRFNAVVIEIAKDISGAATNLSGMSSGLESWFNKFSGSYGAANPTPKPGALRPPTPQRPGNVGDGGAFGGGGRPGGLGGGSGGLFGGSGSGATTPGARPGGGMFGEGGLLGNGGLFGPGGLLGGKGGAGAPLGAAWGLRPVPGAAGTVPVAPVTPPAPAPRVATATPPVDPVSPTAVAAATPPVAPGNPTGETTMGESLRNAVSTPTYSTAIASAPTGGPRGVGVDPTDFRTRTANMLAGRSNSNPLESGHDPSHDYHYYKSALERAVARGASPGEIAKLEGYFKDATKAMNAKTIV